MGKTIRFLFRSLNILLVLTLVASAVAVAYISLPQFGNQALIVRSGSMLPTIDIGSIVVVKSQPKDVTNPLYKKDDIIAFKTDKKSETIVTHRVVSVETGKDGTFYQTKGDANEDIDGWIIDQNLVLGKIHHTVPYVGKVLAFAKSDVGLPTLIILPAALVIFLEVINIVKEIKKQKKKPDEDNLETILKTPEVLKAPRFHITRSDIAISGVFFMLPIIALGVLVKFMPHTFAFYQDSEVSTENVFQAAESFDTQPEQPPATPSASVVINEIMWGGSDTDTVDEWIELRNMTGSPIDLSNWTIDGLGSGTPGTITIPPGKTLPANGFFVIANSASAASILVNEPDHVTSSISLSNEGEQLLLKNSSATVIDTANIVGSWFSGTNTAPKRSMERKTPPSDGDTNGNWHSSNGQINLDGGANEFATPGTVNSSGL